MSIGSVGYMSEFRTILAPLHILFRSNHVDLFGCGACSM